MKTIEFTDEEINRLVDILDAISEGFEHLTDEDDVYQDLQEKIWEAMEDE